MNNPIIIKRALYHPRRIFQLCLPSMFALLTSSCLVTRADIIIDLPDLVLQPNQANQTFTISVQNTGTSVQFTGVQLELITGNGDVSIGGSGGAPAFQAVTLLASGDLFASNNTGDRGAGNFAADFPPNGLTQVFERITSTSSGTVTLGNGTFALAAVTFDTTGIQPGVYSWSAATSPNGMSFFTDTSQAGVVNPTLFDGTLTVVPEPVNVALSIFCGLAVLGGGLRHSRAFKRVGRSFHGAFCRFPDPPPATENNGRLIHQPPIRIFRINVLKTIDSIGDYR
jgi:hypothetical protein